VYHILKSHPNVWWGIGKVSEAVIDEINIYQATKLAMRQAMHNLRRTLRKHDQPYSLFLLIDGNAPINTRTPQKTIIKADETVMLCMMASIVAKVTRDRLMTKYHKQYPVYGFDQHKGYGTEYHLKMLQKYGPSSIHRKTFAPVAKFSK